MPEPVDLTHAFNLPPEDAVNYFRQKGYAFSWDWRDTWQEAHAKVFTVAKAMKLDILQDIRSAVDKAISEGTTLKEFQDGLEPLLRKKGWWGKQLMEDGKVVQLGSARRLETIFRTNVQSAYMAGRYKQQLENVDDRPFLQYVSVMDARTRPAHAALNGKVFRIDDPFWNTHYPPLAFNCRCRTRALTADQVKRKGLTVETGENNMVWEDQPINKNEKRPVAGYRDPETGKTLFTDPGWSSNPGKTALENNLFQKAQAIYEGCTGGNFADASGFPCSQARRVFSDALDGLRQSFDKPGFDEFVTEVLKDQKYPQNKIVAGYIDLDVYDAVAGFGVIPKEPHIWLRKNELTHSRHNKRINRSNTVDPAEAYSIPEMIQTGKVYWDVKNSTVIYALDAADGSESKAAVRVDYNLGGEWSNYIMTIDRIPKNQLMPPQYIEIER